ncbi:ethanolamine utilization protein EutJ [Clostridium malenominatum]|uniref:Ethanolamine utilization protein EutJ n=1 Tax=Clostridium malenominatum TaxID=1539 RepID=A0ABN1ITQ5_9CLOT
MDMLKVNNYIKSFKHLIQENAVNSFTGELKVGVDLGTANIVISVLDKENNPIAAASTGASVVRDGLVLDYVGAVEIVKKLKEDIEERLGKKLTYTAAAVPPGTIGGNRRIIANICESAYMEVVNIIDEPSAAASVLHIDEGAVVDVGGGTTGISILKDGKVIYTADEPTGGTHMSLVLAGYYKISFEEAEKLKRDNKREQEVFPIIKPVVERMASIVKNHISGYEVNKIYLVGGACSFNDFEKTFERELGIATLKPVDPLLVTPLGIAMNCCK